MKLDGEIKAIHYSTGKPVRIRIAGGLIYGIENLKNASETGGRYVAPGLIDNQVNGFMGVDFSWPSLSPDMMVRAVKALNREGVTSFFPTVITNSHDNLLKIFRNLRKSLEEDEVRLSVPGFHLEGPYISPEEGFYGCHHPDYIRIPSWDEFSRYQEEAGGCIRQVTLSPELEGAIEFIRKCTLNNIVVAIGHTNAKAGDIRMAVDAGARVSTHLGNGCANMIHRHNNPLWPQLANDHLTPSVIADGHHLLPEEIQVFRKVKGAHRIILTSDVTHLSGLEPGNYSFFGSEVVMTDDGLIRNPVLDCLAGASLPLRTGVGNMIKFTGCPPDEAFKMASENVAGLYGLTDRGTLEPGRRADLIIFDMIGQDINLRQVWVNGKTVLNRE
ncbi:MAG: N-acetylglucosamine-6-phosphate deacetylase [Bacteroidales bacterium]|jgi:N-acetylglucosamine-6-phosphate deacetylase|nr:N-acetylglucosamine-6-phosphate deacetylase [Bacteroidales bacterium]